LLFGALSQQVTRPLSDLVRAMADIRAGKRSYAERLPTNRNDEIGVMVQGFNSLLDRIAERNA
jgi:methyl-accepting chemotaxis protein